MTFVKGQDVIHYKALKKSKLGGSYILSSSLRAPGSFLFCWWKYHAWVPAMLRVLFVLTGIHLQLERGHPSRGSSAYQEVLFWCHFPQQPCDSLWLSRNEGEPTLEIPKSESVCVGVFSSKVSNCLRHLRFLKMSPLVFYSFSSCGCNKRICRQLVVIVPLI